MSYYRIVAKFGTSLLTSQSDHLDLLVMTRILNLLGYEYGDEVIHRNNM